MSKQLQNQSLQESVSSQERQKDFFISYNKADRLWAEWIAWQLEQSGYSVIIQAWDFRPGGNFVLDMQRAAEESERIIAVLSPDYLTSRFTAPEWAAAFAKDPTGEKGLLLPVRVCECELNGLMPQIVFIDLTNADEAKAKYLLLAGIKYERAKPSIAPVFPGSPHNSITQSPRFPGVLPSIWNIPHQRNPNFTGRNEELQRLRAALNDSGATVLTQAIIGLGGVGKTQLAIEFAYRHSADYDVVWWVRAEEPSTTNTDYTALAAKLELPEKDDRELPVIIEAVRRRLGQTKRWLIIFDNAQAAHNIQAYLPQSQSGHVLITSRNVNWGGAAPGLEVKILQRGLSVEFLLKRTKQTDEAVADELAAELGDLPLALEQAGAYIEATGVSFSDYLRLFRTRRQELWQEEWTPSDYPDTIATTWLLSFQEVERAAPAAAELLNFCAFLAPDAIPLWLLRENARYLPARLAAAVADELAFNRAIAAIRRFSLIEVDAAAQTLSVHRLVQAVSRDRLTDDERSKFIEAAVLTLDAAFPQDSGEVRTWPVCSALLQHAIIIFDHSVKSEFLLPETARLINQSGLYFLGRADLLPAKDAFERALKMYEALLGADHPHVATTVSNIGKVLHQMGDLTEARKQFERAIIIEELTYGPEHPNVGRDLSNLGCVRVDMNDLIGARACFESALRIKIKVFGENHAAAAEDLSNLGIVYAASGDLNTARQYIERALKIDEAVYGVSHPKVAIRINNLGGVLRDLYARHTKMWSRR